jgi:hypothetical protein
MTRRLLNAASFEKTVTVQLPENNCVNAMAYLLTLLATVCMFT